MITIEGQNQIYGVDEGLQSPETARRYKVSFKGFLDYCQVSKYDLLQESPRRLEDRIIGYIRFLHEFKGQGRGTINTSVSAVFHFFEMNDVLLNKRKVKRFYPPDTKEKDRDRAYTHEEIGQMLLNCDERSRMIVLLMASTGMRIGALHELRLSHLTEIPQYSVYKILVYASSPKDTYYTFCTPECKQAIDSYLDYRRRFGDPLRDKAPLIREQFDITDRFTAQYPKSVKPDGIIWITKQILNRSGKKTSDVMRTHGFRKFAISQMIKAKVDYNTREYLAGHRQSRGLDVNYDRTSEEDRLQEYLKAIDLLTINPENRLKIKIHQMESEHSAEWNQLKAQMNELRDLLGSANQKA